MPLGHSREHAPGQLCLSPGGDMCASDNCGLVCKAQVPSPTRRSKRLWVHQLGQWTDRPIINLARLACSIARLLAHLLNFLSSFISHPQIHLHRIPCIQNVSIRARRMPPARTVIRVCTHRFVRARARAISLPRRCRPKWPAPGATRGPGFMVRTECLGVGV